MLTRKSVEWGWKFVLPETKLSESPPSCSCTLWVLHPLTLPGQGTQVCRKYSSFTSAWNCITMWGNFSTAGGKILPPSTTTLACISRAQYGAHSIHSYRMNKWNVKKHVLCNSAWQRDFQSFLPGHNRLHSTGKRKNKNGIVTTDTHCKHGWDTFSGHLWSVPMTPWEWELTGGCAWVHQTEPL